ncbi:MAG: methyltransferase domain-containing protein [Methanobacteriota archaeon]
MTNAGTRNQLDRELWLEKTLKGLPQGLRILDAGAGEQKYKQFCGHLKYVSQDFAQYDGKGDGSGLQTGKWDHGNLDIVCDIASIPEADGSFDAIMCVEVLEHLPDPLLALKEFSRLLRKGGWLILTAPFCSLTHFAPYHFSTGFNRYYYEHHLARLGFDITEIGANGNYFEYLAQELHRTPSLMTKYAGGAAQTRMERWAMRKVVEMVGRASECDSGSQEVLCYGYHVLAVKRGSE